MEGIDRIKEKILQEALEKKQEILDKAKAETENMLKSCHQKADEIKREILERAKKQAEDEKRKILSMSELEERKRFLQEKQRIIDDAFKVAQEHLENLPPEDYRKLIRRMLIESAISGDEEVIIAEKDKSKITPDFISEVNEDLNKLGKAGNLRLSDETRPMLGGFILKSKDLEVNCTFDSLIKIQRDELETRIAKILFEE